MGIKQDIVVKNEFSVPTETGGTRGGTPGSYVMRYMARDGATEALAPIRRDSSEAFVIRYMLREGAVEAHPGDRAGAKAAMARAQGFSGLAFGSAGPLRRPSLSLSDREVRATASEIQSLFDSGHTVLKTVVSFSVDYVSRMGIVDEGFAHRGRGDWAGHVDEARLRAALLAGMRRLAHTFDDLVWVGCVQVDASNVHCHLCMADAGRGSVRPDGTQKGTLSARQMSLFRRGVDAELDRTHLMRHLSADVSAERVNVRDFVKRLTHAAMESRGVPQFLVACLPSERHLWKANSHDPKMRKANEIARAFVREALALPGSGYEAATRAVYEYARRRAEREGLTPEAERRLVDEGDRRVVDACVNGVYSVLSEVPDELLFVRTPVMDVMGTDLEELARARGVDPALEFGLKLRTYSGRLSYHREQRRYATDARRAWEAADAQGAATEASRALYEWYLEEEAYHAALVAKYVSFLTFIPPSVEWTSDVEAWAELERRARVWEALAEAGREEVLSPDEIRERARSLGISAPDYVLADGEEVEARAERFRDVADAAHGQIALDLADEGLRASVDASGELRVEAGPAMPFDEVKALDIHHLDYDFPFAARISRNNVEAFQEAAERREEALSGAVAYLEASGQADLVETLPTDDVRRMAERARSLASEPLVSAFASDGAGIHGARPTVPLDVDVGDELDRAVREAVHSAVQALEDESRSR